jgi:hypothetical protein
VGCLVPVVIHSPIDTTSYGKRRLRELMADVRARIESGLPPEYRGRGAPSSDRAQPV